MSDQQKYLLDVLHEIDFLRRAQAAVLLQRKFGSSPAAITAILRQLKMLGQIRKYDNVLSTIGENIDILVLQAVDVALAVFAKEWNAFYASFDSRSQLRGKIIELETIPIPGGVISNEKNELTCFVAMQYLVKVLIPVPLFGRQKHSPVNASSAVGAEVDYVIIGIERRGECAAASRVMALDQQRWYQREVKGLEEGDMLSADILAVGPIQAHLPTLG
ncbi:hypothetical protein [Candidatus Agathobaculum pullicola]|uniref:hypothetical protein n=1 Tax=Candidatus Agathobaculum pullicola TaxID=2838426 RepID=UPI003F8FBB8F